MKDLISLDILEMSLNISVSFWHFLVERIKNSCVEETVSFQDSYNPKRSICKQNALYKRFINL
jgi:hypothetical protein